MHRKPEDDDKHKANVQNANNHKQRHRNIQDHRMMDGKNRITVNMTRTEDETYRKH